MRAELRRLHSPDVPDDLETFSPADPTSFGILVQAMIGPEGEPGEESFDFLVCSGPWLHERARKQGPVLGRHHLIMHHYDYALLRQTIQGLCQEAKGSTWEEVATYLARFGHWEFEDYQEYTGE